MLTRLFQYGALSGKVRALYGKRLTLDDYRKMSTMHTVSDIADYLKAHPGWSSVLAPVNPSTIHRGDLEYTLRQHLVTEYLSLFKFMPRKDYDLMHYMVTEVETQQIMLFLRQALAGHPERYIPRMPDFFQKHSKIPFTQLSGCTTFHDLLELTRDTGFYTSLARLAPGPSGFPEYTEAELVMRTYQYRSVLDVIRSNYRGQVRTMLLDLIGTEVDLINISDVIRLRHYFPNMTEDVSRFLLPFNHRLKPAFLRELFESEDRGVRDSLLRSSPYAKYFTVYDFPYIEQYIDLAIYDYLRRHMVTEIPSAFTALSFLQLSALELRNLIHMIECVRYGLPPDAIPAYLVGIEAM